MKLFEIFFRDNIHYTNAHSFSSSDSSHHPSSAFSWRSSYLGVPASLTGMLSLGSPPIPPSRSDPLFT